MARRHDSPGLGNKAHSGNRNPRDRGEIADGKRKPRLTPAVQRSHCRLAAMVAQASAPGRSPHSLKLPAPKAFRWTATGGLSWTNGPIRPVRTRSARTSESRCRRLARWDTSPSSGKPGPYQSPTPPDGPADDSSRLTTVSVSCRPDVASAAGPASRFPAAAHS